jgi:hypothetical protein
MKSIIIPKEFEVFIHSYPSFNKTSINFFAVSKFNLFLVL